MADISVQKKSGPDLTKVWAAAAVLAVIALMGWLLSSQDEARMTLDAPVAEDAVEAGPAAETVDLAVVGGAPEQYVDRTVRISGVPVAASLGNRGFWADVPGANPFLVILDPAVQDVSWIEPGNERTLQGVVQPVTEEDLDMWVQSSAIQADARSQAAFVSHYLHVSDVMP